MNLLLVGRIIGASGLKGEVKVRTFTAHPQDIGNYGPLITEAGRSLIVEKARSSPGEAVILCFRGIDNRKSAESLKGARVYVPRAALPKTKRNEFYHVDLIGLRVEDPMGVHLGTVSAIHNFGAGDLIEFRAKNGKTTMVPFKRDSVPDVDLGEKRIVVLAPASEA